MVHKRARADECVPRRGGRAPAYLALCARKREVRAPPACVRAIEERADGMADRKGGPQASQRGGPEHGRSQGRSARQRAEQ
eukprot:3719104-Alexandrium_andersonii.AAC.1